MFLHFFVDLTLLKWSTSFLNRLVAVNDVVHYCSVMCQPIPILLFKDGCPPRDGPPCHGRNASN